MDLQSTAGNRPEELTASVTKCDQEVLGLAASGDPESIGGLVDHWADRLFGFTDSLRLREREAEDVVEEALRRLAFEAPRLTRRPEKLSAWVQQTLRDCAAAVVSRRSFDATKVLSVASPVVAAFSLFVSQGKLAEALTYLNGQTPFRFTGVYRLDGLTVANLYLYDRQSGFLPGRAAEKSTDTYCVWIQDTLSVVQMCDSMSDPRADGHSRREVVRSYCGGPIRGAEGKLLGTICHFDYEPQANTFDMLPVLDAVGPLLARLVAPD